jgi:hypothetical protein
MMATARYRVLALLAAAPFCAAAGAVDVSPLELEFLEFLAEEPEVGKELEDALLSREFDRVLQAARGQREAAEARTDER